MLHSKDEINNKFKINAGICLCIFVSIYVHVCGFSSSFCWVSFGLVSFYWIIRVSGSYGVAKRLSNYTGIFPQIGFVALNTYFYRIPDLFLHSKTRLKLMYFLTFFGQRCLATSINLNIVLMFDVLKRIQPCLNIWKVLFKMCYNVLILHNFEKATGNIPTSHGI